MRTLFLSICVVVASHATAVPIDLVVPAVSPAGNGAQMTIIANGLGSMSDFARFPGNKDSYPVAVGTNWIRVPVPETWSGNVQAYDASTGLWTDPSPIEITFSWSKTQWSPASSTWKINSAGVAGVAMSDLVWHCLVSYSSWACASDFSPSYLGTTSTGSGSRSDGENVLAWNTSGQSSGTIAVCSWRYETATGNIMQFDISFNAQHFQWATNGDVGKMDVSNIATHELGHSIGFLDQYGSLDFNETMYGLGANGEILRRTLHAYDVAGAESIYGHATGRQNQTAGKPAGWFSPFSPRNTADATTTLAPLPTTLTGGVPTYLNVSAINNGGDCASPIGSHRVYRDEIYTFGLPWVGVWDPAEIATWRNLVLTTKGGLHTFGVEYDNLNEHSESNESDNYYERQFAYTPQALLNQIPVVQGAPPARGLGVSPNSDGYSGTTGWWAVVATMPLNVLDDYDTYVYDTATGPLTGFRNVLESTYAGSGMTDFVVVNGNVLGNGATFHAGIVEYSNSNNSNAVIQTAQDLGGTLIPSTTYGSPTSLGGFVMGGNDIVRIHEVYLGSTTTTYDINLDILSGGMDLAMSLFPSASSTYNQYEAVAFADAGDVGEDERISYKPASAGYYAVVVYKRSTEQYGQGGTYELSAGLALSNLDATNTPTGWFQPVTPRVLNNSTTTYAPAESNLPGNSLATYLNMAMLLEGPSDTPSWVWQMWKDEDSYLYGGSIGAGAIHQQYVNINNGPHNIRGGRHTLSARLDPALLVPESDESDNVFDLQLVWSPLATTKNVPLVRSAPPARGLSVHPNSDGFSFTPGLSHSWVMAATPFNGGDDYDLIAYSDYSDAFTGFSSELTRSEFGDNGTDFVVGHFSVGLGTIHSGVVRTAIGGGGAGFAHDQSDAVGNRAGESGSFLAESFDPKQVVQIYEALLVAGETYSVRLDLVGGTDQIAFEVFSGAPTVSSRGTGLAQSTQLGTTTDVATFVAPSSSWYPIVVYRTNGSGINQDLKYDLQWHPGAPTPAPEFDAGSRLFFAGATPNPAPGRATLSFTLPKAGPVQLDVFDLRGRRVRNLVDGVMVAGPHQIHWDGSDQHGSGAASGTYYLRLVAAGEQQTRRVTVVR